MPSSWIICLLHTNFSENINQNIFDFMDHWHHGWGMMRDQPIGLVGHLSPGPCLDLELGNAKVADFDPRHIRGASGHRNCSEKKIWKSDIFHIVYVEFPNRNYIFAFLGGCSRLLQVLQLIAFDHRPGACDWLVQQHVQRLQVSVDDHGIEGMQITHCSRSISTHFDLLSIDLKGWKHSA